MEENNQNQQPQGLQIELKPEIGVGVNANRAYHSLFFRLHPRLHMHASRYAAAAGSQPRSDGSRACKASFDGPQR